MRSSVCLRFVLHFCHFRLPSENGPVSRVEFNQQKKNEQRQAVLVKIYFHLYKFGRRSIKHESQKRAVKKVVRRWLNRAPGNLRYKYWVRMKSKFSIWAICKTLEKTQNAVDGPYVRFSSIYMISTGRITCLYRRKNYHMNMSHFPKLPSKSVLPFNWGVPMNHFY